MLNNEEIDKLFNEQPNKCVLCGSLSDLVSVDVLTQDTDENGDIIGYTELPDYYMCGIHALEYNRLSEEKLKQYDDMNEFLIGWSKTIAYTELLIKYTPLKAKNKSKYINQKYNGGD